MNDLTQSLRSIGHEEGRVRYITATSTDPARFEYDYFVKDHQGNVRMILTDETHIAYNTCTMEATRASEETTVFGQTGAANEVDATRHP